MVPPKAHGPSSGQWFPLMAPSGEDAGGNGEEKEEEKEGGRWGGDCGFLKEGLGREEVGSRKAWRGDEENDRPPGTWLKCPSLSNLLLYFEKQQEGCRRRKDAGDGWSDTGAVTDLMNGLTTLAKWPKHHGRDGGQQKRQRTLHYWGTNALTKWAFCHGAIFLLKYSTCSGIMLTLITICFHWTSAKTEVKDNTSKLQMSMMYSRQCVYFLFSLAIYSKKSDPMPMSQKSDNRADCFFHTWLRFLLTIDHCLDVWEPKGESRNKRDKAVEPLWW